MGNQNPKIHRAKRGLDLPVTGAVTTLNIVDAPPVSTVALLAQDYAGMRPSFKVKEGDAVKRGQILFEDRKNPGVLFTSFGCGTVSAINRGERRAFLSIEIKLSDDDGDESLNEVTYKSYKSGSIDSLNFSDIKELLIESGMWTAFKSRPFGKIPPVDATPDAIFVTAMDSSPLAPPVEPAISENSSAFEAGLKILSILSGGKKFFYCKKEGEKLPVENLSGAEVHEFSGPHPSGTPGFHIHSVFPVNRERTAWHIGYQDVIAAGKLFLTGKLDVERIISIAGPAAKEPKIVKTRLGAALKNLVDGEYAGDDVRILSGSILSGYDAGEKVFNFLGRYHNQISLLQNDRSRRFLGWLAPGSNIFSVTRLFLSAFMPSKKFAFSTDRFGGKRTLVPFASYDKIFAFDLMTIHLLRAVLAGDLESAEELGVLELDEEDVALLTFVCPSKNEYGPVLRDVLERLEKEA